MNERKTYEKLTYDELITLLINRQNKLKILEDIIKAIEEYLKDNPNEKIERIMKRF